MKTGNYGIAKQLLLNTPVPETTRTYKAIPHKQVIDCTLEAIDKAGLILANETYSASAEGLIATGRYTIKNVADNEMQLQIAWLNSYNKKKRLTYGLGSLVTICMNGMVSADMGFFKKKHQGEIQEFTPVAIAEYIKRAEEVFKKLQEEREMMKEIQLTKRITAELLGRAVVEEEFITTTQLNIIKREMLHPTHDYGHPNSMWEIYNFCTFSMKDLHPSLWMRSHLTAHSFFAKASGLIVPTKVSVPVGVDEVSPNQVNMYAVPGFDDEGIDASPEVVEKENSETSDECIPTEEPVKGITTDSQTTEYSDLY